MKSNIASITKIISTSLIILTSSLSADEHWKLGPEKGITSDATKLLAGKDQYSDHIAMGGRKVDAIIEWKVTKVGTPELNRIIRFPLLRKKQDDTRGSFKHEFNSSDDPQLSLNDKPLPDQ